MTELPDNTNLASKSDNYESQKLFIHPSNNKPQRMTHKQWKAYLKKMKRKQKRAAEAKEREMQEKSENKDVEKSNSDEEREREREENERRKQHELWLERERQAEAVFKAKKEWEAYEKKRKEEIERKIREEWEERVRKEKEEEEEKEKKEQEKRSKQEKLLKEATANENTNDWHLPFAPVIQEQQVDHCPFFKKMAACRFGDHCSRYHDYPDISNTILIPNMFSSFQLEQSIVDNYDTDISLEYDENELYQSFKDFYEDVVPEIKTVGTIVQLKVCCNCEPHLRGNVYVQFKRQSAAQKAYEKFNARWYGGRQLTCIFVKIESWKSAICGLASKKRCPKGKSCNFLHVFRNPGGEFTELDYQDASTDKSDRWADTDRSNSLRQSSREPVHSSYSHKHSLMSHQSSQHRSRSSSRSESSRSTTRSKRSRSRSKGLESSSRSRTSFITSSHRSRSRSQERKHKRSRSRSRKRSKRRSQSPIPASKHTRDAAVSIKKSLHPTKRKKSLSSSSDSSSESELSLSKNTRGRKYRKSKRTSSDSSPDEETKYEYIEKTKETLKL